MITTLKTVETRTKMNQVNIAVGIEPVMILTWYQITTLTIVTPKALQPTAKLSNTTRVLRTALPTTLPTILPTLIQAINPRPLLVASLPIPSLTVAPTVRYFLI